MASKLQAISNATLGFLGLNTQDNGVTLDSGYATKALNCVIDKNGRLASRKGWTPVTTDNGDLNDDEYIESIYEVLSVGGASTIISAGGGKIFTGTTTLTRLNVYGTDASGPAVLSPQPTFTGNRWQWCTLQEGSYGSSSSPETYAVTTQRGNIAMVYREGAHSGPFVLQRIGTDYGTAPTGVGTFDPDCCHAAFGRVWVAGLTENRTTVFYSNLLDPSNFAGTGTGLLDISSKVGGNDEIVAISSHNSFLVIFCKRNIVIYANADTPSSLTIVDVIPGVGCISRDSVQQTGNDIVFLSASGVRSLARTVQEKSMPLRELSLNIRDDLVTYIEGENHSNIKSMYYERDAFYLLVMPSLNQVFCFDTRRLLDNGAARVTVWDNLVPKALFAAANRVLYLGMQGGIAQYGGYSDNNNTYRMEYYTTNTDFGSPFTLKFLKKAKVIIIASGTQDVVIKYGFDYSSDYSSRVFTKDFIGSSSQYNISEYSNLPGQTGYTGSEYNSGIAIAEIDLNLGGSGKILQFGVEAVITGTPINLQQMSVYTTTGKMI
jgi:hypothetical protein